MEAKLLQVSGVVELGVVGSVETEVDKVVGVC